MPDAVNISGGGPGVVGDRHRRPADDEDVASHACAAQFAVQLGEQTENPFPCQHADRLGRYTLASDSRCTYTPRLWNDMGLAAYSQARMDFIGVTHHP